MLPHVCFQVRLANNDWSKNAAGGCQGLSQPQRPLMPSRPFFQREQKANPADALVGEDDGDGSPMDVEAAASFERFGQSNEAVGSSGASVEF